jgi:hypothetical protein
VDFHLYGELRSVYFAVDFIITSEIYGEKVSFTSVLVTTLYQLKQNDHCTVILERR